MKVSWRTIPTVLLEDEVLDKAFSRARKAADRVDDSDKVFRVSKQTYRMLQTVADVIYSQITEMVECWPSLDQSPQSDIALIDACVGCDD